MNSSIVTARELFQREYDPDIFLWGTHIVKTELSGFVGGSDTGKSTLLRNLALHIVLGEESYLGLPLKTKHQRVLLISIEDGEYPVGTMFQKHYQEYQEEPRLENLHFVFGPEGAMISNLEAACEQQAYDLIMIDCYSDVYEGSSGNDQMETKRFLRKYADIAKSYQTAILFLHHLKKASDETKVSKADAIGSSAFETKMRSLFSLSKPSGYESTRRELKILKGNYTSSAEKKVVRVLDFIEDSLSFQHIETKGPVAKTTRLDFTDSEKQAIIEYCRKHKVQQRGEGKTYPDTQTWIQATYNKSISAGRLVKWLNPKPDQTTKAEAQPVSPL